MSFTTNHRISFYLRFVRRFAELGNLRSGERVLAGVHGNGTNGKNETDGTDSAATEDGPVGRYVRLLEEA